MPEALRPVCFMIMPFGNKRTGISDGSGPVAIDFNSLWERALQPAIDAMGYMPVRADYDLGTLIIHEMLERLTLADLVVADITIPNANVYYEVGIRHAARKTGCVLIAADWARPVFDVGQMRRVSYPLANEEVSGEEAREIAAILKEAVPAMSDSVSPPHTMEGFPDIDPKRATSFRSFVRMLSDFQSEAHSIRVAPKAERPEMTRRLLERHSSKGASSGPVLPAVALELLYLVRDALGWQEARTYIEGLPEHTRRRAEVQEQLALAMGKTGEPAQAAAILEKLIEEHGESPERRGLIGGRYKELYNTAGAAVEKLRYLEKAIESYELGMWLDLNEYYCSSNLPRLLLARDGEGDEERSRGISQLVVAACERARRLGSGDEWLKPTLLGAAFFAGDVSKARQLAREVALEGADDWKLDSTVADLMKSIELQRDPERKEGLTEMLAGLRELLS